MEKFTIMDVMLYCDGALGPDDMSRVAAAIAGDPKLQEMERDLRDGAAATKAAFAAIGNAPVPLDLTRSILRRSGGAKFAGRVDPALWRYAAAIVIGMLVGGMGTLIGLRVNNPAYLHLAAVQSGPTNTAASNEFRATLGLALRESEFGKIRTYRSGNIDGSVSVTRRFVTGNGTACAEFSHELVAANSRERLDGIACERLDGGWEIIQLPSGR